MHQFDQRLVLHDQNNRLTSSIRYRLLVFFFIIIRTVVNILLFYKTNSISGFSFLLLTAHQHQTGEGDPYASTHSRQLLLPIPMKTEIFISIHFYFRLANLFRIKSSTRSKQTIGRMANAIVTATTTAVIRTPLCDLFLCVFSYTIHTNDS